MLFLKIVAIVISLLYSMSSLFYATTPTVNAQSNLQTINYRNLVIDLGNDVKTNAQLTYPVVGKGPFPGVLLVPGSGIIDMNETLGIVRIDNKTGAKIYPPTRPYFQLAEYLSERGFAVLRYDKRGIGENSTIVDSNVWGNLTIDNLIQDAEKALDVLIQQPEVDPSRITAIGHSEGTVITPRIASDNPDKIKNIVLMGATAQNLSKIAEYQAVITPLLYAKEVLDHNHNGLLSLQEANKNPVFSTWFGNLTLFLTQNISNTSSKTTTTTNTSTPSLSQRLDPKYNTNNDVYVDIDNELKPKLLENYKSHLVTTPGGKCTGDACPIWQRSQYALQPNLSIIGNVSSNNSILILQGENDTQTPVQQAFLLQQKLTDVRHPDHALITYPNLGHVFYPSSKWATGLGPIEQYVLADLYAWLEAHSGFTQSPSPSSSFSNSSSTGQG